MSISFSSISGLQGLYCIFLWASFQNWFSCCNSVIFLVSSARFSSNAQLAAIACYANVSTIAIILAICSYIEWSSELSTIEMTFLASAIAFHSNIPTDGANYWCVKSAKWINDIVINDKQFSKNFNIFVLIRKEIQEKERIQFDNLERERIWDLFLEKIT